MNRLDDDRKEPGSTQNEKAPQDETPATPPAKRNRQSAPGKSAKNEKRKPFKRKRKHKLLPDDTDIADETTI